MATKILDGQSGCLLRDYFVKRESDGIVFRIYLGDRNLKGYKEFNDYELIEDVEIEINDKSAIINHKEFIVDIRLTGLPIKIGKKEDWTSVNKLRGLIRTVDGEPVLTIGKNNYKIHHPDMDIKVILGNGESI